MIVINNNKYIHPPIYLIYNADIYIREGEIEKNRFGNEEGSLISKLINTTKELSGLTIIFDYENIYKNTYIIESVLYDILNSTIYNPYEIRIGLIDFI